MIEFDGVTKSYPDGTIAVDDLDLVLPDGQVTVLVGPYGCRKTTLRMIEPTSGTIRTDGDDIVIKSPPELRRPRRAVL